MTYEEMFEAIRQNHSAHWGGTFAEMKASDKYIEGIAIQYPELYQKALDDFNEILRKM